ncbi:LytR family transcriptional regulator [Georgenia thermotolerans]|uniref:LytR family transcriptional regulator n=1 Tax=Georgenia thermotolerans TaxID=527326 RepID=A0A7J5USN2_9MICO|nr:LytR family transcriptional regulator [Georgenia thermotolerans]
MAEDAGAQEGGPVDRGQQRRRRARRALLIVVGIVVVLVAGLAGVAAYLQARIDASIERIDDPFAPLTNRPDRVASGAGPVNILVLGSDSRISAGEPSQWAAGAQRTDTMMVVQISGDREHAYVMSIPRDSWVEIPGHGQNKINAAYSFGGPSLMIQTVENLTGIRIDHFAIADFESFAALTDELGGVEITMPNGLDNTGVALPPGTHTLDGEQALAYARQRHGVPGGDLGRVQRQQNWMRSILQAVYRADRLADPVGLTRLLQTVGQTVAVDEGFTMGKMRNLAVSMRDIRPNDLVFMTAPNLGTGRSPDGAQSIVLLDEGRFGALCNALAADSVANYLEVNPGAVVTLGDDVA